MQRLLFTLLITCTQLVASHGQELTLLDIETNSSISGAFVQIGNDQFTSDNDGVITHQYTGEQTVTISHLNYETYHQKVNLDKTQSITLSPKNINLDEVIITGQFEAQSIDQTVFSAKTIDAATIEQQGAIDLSDALRNTLNITITPNKSAGSSQVNMLGLDGAYVKILIDGIPMVNINGNGNNADISQIDMSMIERVEIVEGPMAVNYGANASAGVVNLITKRNTTDKINVQVYAQEETVGTEYGKGKGRRLQNITTQYSFNDKLGINAKVRKLQFNGFWNQYKGFIHHINDGKRGFDWNPKKQINWSIGAHYKLKNIRLKYGYDRFTQQLDIPSKTINENEHAQTRVKNPFSSGDLRYNDLRQVHNLTLSGKIRQKANFNINSAYSTIDREELQFAKYIITKQEQINQKTSSHYRALLSRGTFSSLIPTGSSINFQLGYEWNYDQIRASNLRSGSVASGTSRHVTKSINDIALFLNTEWKATKYLTLRPGIRTFVNSHFSSALIYSLNTKYVISEVMDIRLSAGRSYRTPNLRELYFYFVDANHDIQGNPNLSPEDGYGLALDLKRTSHLDQFTVKTSVKVFYNDIKGKISMAIVNRSPLQFQNLNINRYRSKGISLDNKLLYKKVRGQAGISYIGYFNKINTNDIVQPDEFLYSVEVNANVSYQINNPNISIGAFYKRTGAREQYQLIGSKYEKRRVSPFDWLDASATWKPTSSISLQGGVKNIFDIANLNGSLSGAGAHSPAPTATGLSYGRSYFIKLQYTFIKK